MSLKTPQEWIREIQTIDDPAIKAALLAGLVSERFRDRGFEPVVVGGSAIELYTEGAYMSGDIDICWAGVKKPTPVERANVMAEELGGTGGSRSWKVAGLFVDLLGELETYGQQGLAELQTPAGRVLLPPLEELLVERVFSATAWTGGNPSDEDCARVLMSIALAGQLAINWEEVERIAAIPDYDCLAEVRQMREAVSQLLSSEQEPGS